MACPHDHGPKSRPRPNAALAVAEAACIERGEKWTAPRRRTYELLLLAEAPVTAYDLVAASSRPGKFVHPPTIYRALDFLITMGLAHRVKSDSAYVACADPGLPHEPQFLICDCCRRSTEIPYDATVLARAAAEASFSVKAAIVEVHGLCTDCR